MDLSRTAATGAVKTLAGQGLRFLVQLASVTVLARILAPEDYGLFAMVFAVVGLAAVVGDFGLSMASIQAQDLTPGQRDNLFWTNVALGLVLSAVVWVLAHPVADLYGRPELVEITQAVAPIFLLNSLAAQLRAEVTSRLRFTWLAVTDVSVQVLGLAVAVAVGLAGGGYWALVIQQLVVALTTLPFLAAVAGWRPGWPVRGESMGRLYRFGLSTLGVQTLVYLTSNIDSVLIGRVAGPQVLGVYGRAYQLFRLPLQQVAAPLTRVALPVLSRIQDDDERYVLYVHRLHLLLTYTFGGFFFVLAAVNDPLIDIVLGDQWDAAKPLFLILSLGGVFQAMGYIYYWIFLSRAKTWLQLRLTVVGRTLMIVAMVVGAAWGATGVAIAASAGQALVWLLNTWFGLPRTGLRRRPVFVIALRPLLLYSVMTLGALPLSAALDDTNPWIQGGTLGAAILAYLALAIAVVGPVRRDVTQILDSLTRARGR